MAAQARAAIRIAAAADQQRSDLAALATFLRGKLREADFDIGPGDTHIVPVFLDDNERAVRFSAFLNEAGFGVRPIRPPSVPAGTSRLRLSLNAKLSIADLARFTDALISIRDQKEIPLHAVRP
jgi:8-amino-7-oxononanoate synthase